MEGKIQPITFNLIRIITEQFAILHEAYTEGARNNLSLHLNFNVDIENKIIAVKSIIRFEQGKVPFLILESSCHFSIESQSWDSFLDSNSNEIKINKSFLSHLALISVGTARGILHAKTESSPYNQFLLPTINVAELVRDDIVLESII